MMKFENEAGLVNFVCIVFELGDKMLTLSSMENLIVPCNLITSPRSKYMISGYQPGRADNRRAGNSVSHIQILSYRG